MTWQKVGYLPNNKAVYCNEEGEYAKEEDFAYLVRMNDEELKSVEAYREG